MPFHPSNTLALPKSSYHPKHIHFLRLQRDLHRSHLPYKLPNRLPVGLVARFQPRFTSHDHPADHIPIPLETHDSEDEPPHLHHPPSPSPSSSPSSPFFKQRHGTRMNDSIHPVHRLPSVCVNPFTMQGKGYINPPFLPLFAPSFSPSPFLPPHIS